MLILFSHLLAFSVLFIAAVSDLDTTEVPDLFPALGVIGGIMLHAAASLQQGVNFSVISNMSVLVSDPVNWLFAFGDPLLWSLGIGLFFSVYGWGLYLLGGWGGADAFAMSVLGFAAPYSLSGPGVLHGVDMFVNILLAGFAYTMLFSLYKSFKHEKIWKLTLEKIRGGEKRISLEVIAAGFLSLLGGFTGSFKPLNYFVLFLVMIFLYRFMKVIQEEAMEREVEVEKLEGGEVVAKNLELETFQSREKNWIGKTLERIRGLEYMPSGLEEVLDGAENRLGYPEIVGITQQQIQELERRNVKQVEVKEGIRFVPVYPVALLLTELGIGVKWVFLVLN